ncbi:MAG: hypothetical protein R2836_00440 [Chitinophagales bacterium]
MKEITISNDIFYDKDYFQTFAKQSKYKFFAVNADAKKHPRTHVSRYVREVIGNDVETVISEIEAMTTAETQQIKAF